MTMTTYKDVNEKNSRGETPLHRATTAKEITHLLKEGANPNLKDDNGNTPLHVAASREI